jgi:hypothetical protein
MPSPHAIDSKASEENGHSLRIVWNQRLTTLDLATLAARAKTLQRKDLAVGSPLSLGFPVGAEDAAATAVRDSRI